jgi:hypothetical protein
MNCFLTSIYKHGNKTRWNINIQLSIVTKSMPKKAYLRPKDGEKEACRSSNFVNMCSDSFNALPATCKSFHFSQLLKYGQNFFGQV